MNLKEHFKAQLIRLISEENNKDKEKKNKDKEKEFYKEKEKHDREKWEENMDVSDRRKNR